MHSVRAKRISRLRIHSLFFPLSAVGKERFFSSKTTNFPPFRPILSSSVPFPSFPPSPPLRATMAQKSDTSSPPSLGPLPRGGGGKGDENKGGNRTRRSPVGRTREEKEGNGGGGDKTLSSPFLYGETSPSISPLLFFSSRGDRRDGQRAGPSLPSPFPH